MRTITRLSNADLNAMTNKELVAYINDNFSDNVLSRFNMTRPNEKKSKKADLVQFIENLYKAMIANQQKNAENAPVATSTKPAPKKPAPKKPEPKKTEESKADAVETQTRVSRKEREFAVRFPDFIERQIDDKMVKYTKCDDLYHTVDDIRKASEDGYSILFACFWSPRLLKQFDYKRQFDVDNVPASFPDNLDTAELLLTCNTMDKVYAISPDTEAMYAFREEDLEHVDGIRISNGLEFEIYQYKDAE